MTIITINGEIYWIFVDSFGLKGFLGTTRQMFLNSSCTAGIFKAGWIHQYQTCWAMVTWCWEKWTWSKQVNRPLMELLKHLIFYITVGHTWYKFMFRLLLHSFYSYRNDFILIFGRTVLYYISCKSRSFQGHVNMRRFWPRYIYSVVICQSCATVCLCIQLLPAQWIVSVVTACNLPIDQDCVIT